MYRRTGILDAIRQRGRNPLRGIHRPDPMQNGLASLGAALVNGPTTRANARQAAFDAEEKRSHSLFEEGFKRQQAKDAADERALSHRERADATKQAHADALESRRMTNEHNQSVDNETERHHHELEHQQRQGDITKQTDIQQKANAKDREDGARSFKDALDAHHKNNPDPKQTEAAKLSLGIWESTRKGAMVREPLPDGKFSNHYDPVLHQQLYNQEVTNTGRKDLQPWKSQTDSRGSDQGPQSIGPLPDPAIHYPSGSDLPIDGKIDGNRRSMPQRQATGDAPVSFDGAPASAAPSFDGPSKASANHPLDAVLSRLPTDDQHAFARILATGDQKRIAAAEERLRHVGGGATDPAATTTSTPAGEYPVDAEMGE